MRKKKIVLHLTGGLGNQLFQLAAAIGCSNESSILLEAKLGKPRSNQNGNPDLYAFKLPPAIAKGRVISSPIFLIKGCGYLLRNGLTQKLWEKIPGFLGAARFIVGVFLSVRFCEITIPVVAHGNGKTEIKTSRLQTYLIGYFQSSSWARSEKVFPILKELTPAEHCDARDELIALASREKPLVVHYRLTDYKDEKFGIPSQSYYERAIYELWRSGEHQKIWVFSDEIEVARKIFPQELLSDVRWVEDSTCSPVCVLETMRHGKGYVIANSTFSWWGAFLSHTPDAKVIGPEPWFKVKGGPSDLIIDAWKGIDPAWG
jgi:hypothetical protein